VTSLLILFLYAIGLYDFVMTVARDQNYFSDRGYRLQVLSYFATYPVPLMALWGFHIVTGILAPLVAVFLPRAALWLMAVSVVCDAVLVAFTTLFRDRAAIFGPQMFLTDLTILVLSGLYLWYLFRFRRPAKG
jgi:hypothetical protein